MSILDHPIQSPRHDRPELTEDYYIEQLALCNQELEQAEQAVHRFDVAVQELTQQEQDLDTAIIEAMTADDTTLFTTLTEDYKRLDMLFKYAPKAKDYHEQRAHKLRRLGIELRRHRDNVRLRNRKEAEQAERERIQAEQRKEAEEERQQRQAKRDKEQQAKQAQQQAKNAAKAQERRGYADKLKEFMEGLSNG